MVSEMSKCFGRSVLLGGEELEWHSNNHRQDTYLVYDYSVIIDLVCIRITIGKTGDMLWGFLA